jgi:hypothetical protein
VELAAATVLPHLPTLLMAERLTDKTICTTECQTGSTEFPVPIQLVRDIWETGIRLVTAIMWPTKYLLNLNGSYLLLMKLIVLDNRLTEKSKIMFLVSRRIFLF